MWYLYLDESGDLGFDFVNKKPSRYFTISILALSSLQNNRMLINSVKHTLKRKFKRRNVKKCQIELKGSKISFAIKQYFYQQCRGIKFGVYSICLNKKRLYPSLIRDKDRVYNYVARLVLDQIPFERADSNVELIVDRCKTKPEIEEFNSYIFRMLKGRLDPKAMLNIFHRTSHQSMGLQAVDVFGWGIFRKYERKDLQWYSIFAEEKVEFEREYFPEK